MDIKLVIFDWSGTISDDRKPVFEANTRMMVDHGLVPLPFDKWLSTVTMTPGQWFSRHGIKKTHEEIFEIYRKHYAEIINAGLMPVIYPDAIDTLRYLKMKQKRLAVLSSHPLESLTQEADHYAIAEFIDMVSANSFNKTDGLEAICLKTGINAKNALYVGDTVYDIQSAKKAGVFSAGICTGYHTREMLEREGPDMLLGSLSELKGKI